MLAAFVDGLLPDAERSTAVLHVDQCVNCCERVTALATLTDTALRPPTIGGGVFGWSVATGRTGTLNLLLVSDRLLTVNGLTNAGRVFIVAVAPYAGR